MNVLDVSQLNKSFGKKDVLIDLDMKIPENSIFGFVGQNGSGKTTTMKIILGLLKADSGNITVCGEKVSHGETKTNRHIGYLPDVPEFYGYMNPMEYLLLCGEITGLSKKDSLRKGEELLNLVGLNGENRKIKSFSRGMRQRLGIAQALINEPRLLICDEPTSALDPIGRKEILDILLSIKGKTTVIFSTHILSDVERVCDYVAVLHKGKLAIQGPLSEVREKYSTKGFIIEFENKKQLNFFSNLKEIKNMDINISRDKNSLVLSLNDEDLDGQILIDLMSKNKLLPLRFEKIEPSLENLYTELVKWDII